MRIVWLRKCRREYASKDVNKKMSIEILNGKTKWKSKIETLKHHGDGRLRQTATVQPEAFLEKLKNFWTESAGDKERSSLKPDPRHCFLSTAQSL